jgi:surface polysaccharide O-acyltransferase-like enzyme
VLSVAALVWLVARPATARSRALAATIRVLSDNSLGIYILHPMIIFEIGKHIGGLLDPGLPLSLVGFAVLTVGGLAAATVVSALLAAGPLAATIGSRRRRAATSWFRAQSSGSSAG